VFRIWSIGCVWPMACVAAAFTSVVPIPSTALAADSGLEAAYLTAPPAALGAYAGAELRQALNGAVPLVIRGERLNGELLLRFYARHDFRPVWATRPMQANSLTNAVLRAGDHGLTPDLFHAGLLRPASALAPLDRELLLSDAFLSYTDALGRGLVPIESRRDDEVLTPGPFDAAAALDAAIESPDPAALIEAWAPATPTYRLLRQALRDTDPGSTIGRGTAAPSRRRQIAVNLERERWLPRRLPADRVWVNVADERLVLYRNDQPVFSTKVIVGQDVRHNQSPEFQATIDGVFFNPPWNIPPDIAANEILPKANRDSNYLTQHHMVLLPDGGVQQLAGPNSGLGQLMLDMRNRFDVYLHDTPSKNLFSRDDRRVSHGCIRVENLAELTALLMQQPIGAIDQAIAMGGTTRTDLPQPVPVFVVYETAFADTDGSLQFRPDVYRRDPEIWQSLETPRRSLAQRAMPNRDGG